LPCEFQDLHPLHIFPGGNLCVARKRKFRPIDLTECCFLFGKIVYKGGVQKWKGNDLLPSYHSSDLCPESFKVLDPTMKKVMKPRGWKSTSICLWKRKGTPFLTPSLSIPRKRFIWPFNSTWKLKIEKKKCQE
jgi:hypothetical protein